MDHCIFPNGDDGWHCDPDHSYLPHTNYQLMDQDGIVNPILYSRSLGQQFLVNQFAKSELSGRVTLHRMQSERNVC